MIVLPTKNAILKKVVLQRLTAEKRDACDFNFCDFDGVQYQVKIPLEDKNTMFILMNVPFWGEIENSGPKDALQKYYGDYLDNDFSGDGIQLKINIDDFKEPEAAEKFSDLAADIKNNVVGEIFVTYFNALRDESPIESLSCFHINNDTAVFVTSGKDRVYVTFALTFMHKTDRLIANVFLAEFVETRRKMGAAPMCTFSTMMPNTLKDVDPNDYADHVFSTFAILPTHITSDEKITKATKALLGFRQFLNYHVKSSKSFFHQRMRIQVASMQKILNRAKVEKEKKRKNTSGKIMHAKS